MDIVENAKLWAYVVLKPRAVLKRERSAADMKYAFSNVFAAAILATLIKIIISGINATATSTPSLLTKQLHSLGTEASGGLTVTGTAFLAITNLTAIFAILLIGWGIGGWIISKISHRFTETGDLTTQLYLTSLFMPAFAVAGTILSYLGNSVIVPAAADVSYNIFRGGFYIWGAAVAAFLLYAAYEYILALAETYKYGEGAALASCVIGGIITGIVIIIVIVSALGPFLGLLFI